MRTPSELVADLAAKNVKIERPERERQQLAQRLAVAEVEKAAALAARDAALPVSVWGGGPRARPSGREG